MNRQTDFINFQFCTRRDHWTPFTAPLHLMFSDEEIALFERSDRMFRTAARTVAILSFENNFAALGGLAAVLRHYPVTLKHSGEQVIIMTPLHTGATAVRAALENGALVERFSGVTTRVCDYSATVSCYEETGAAVPTYHIGIDGRFTAGNNPYGYADPEQLLIDALAFCAVVPTAATKLGFRGHLMFHAHDWETASIALFARYALISGVLDSAKTVLTLHNSFDAPLPDHHKQRFFKKPIKGDTVLQVMLPLLSGPLTTVSTPFAEELRNDPLQCGVFADHLQDLFRKNPPIGIENGMFGKPDVPFTKKEITAAEIGEILPLLRKKKSWHKQLLTACVEEKDPRSIGTFSCAALDQPLVPILFMSGRLDFAQKGFDIIFNAIKQLPKGTVHLFFCPTLHTAHDDLGFFREIAENECAGDIVIWPFRLTAERYRQFLLGSSFLVMPSLYEPFGSASEGLLHGTPVIARATGGLLAQILPGPTAALPASCSTLFPISSEAPANGILFRESYPDATAKEVWRTLLGLPPERRMELPLYQSMVNAATRALTTAAAIHSDDQRYIAMILQGLRSVQGHTWDGAVQKYRDIFDVAQFRG